MLKMRVARPTDDLEPIINFYQKGVGLEITGSFEGHNGFDGVMLGRDDLPYHFEFTHQHGHQVGKAPTQNNLIVFYYPDYSEWEAAVNRMLAEGFIPVKFYNPYWDERGKTFEDANGYRVVFQNAQWGDRSSIISELTS